MGIWVCKGLGKRGWGGRSRSPPSVSSWARPPLGTSCRKSLRRQKSRRGRVLLKHCSTALRKHWGADTLPSSLQTCAQEGLLCPPSPGLPPVSKFPAPSTSHLPVREEGQENGSHRVPQISEANMTRAEKQCVGSLEGQRTVRRLPYVSTSTSTFQQHAARCRPQALLHSQTPPSFPHWVLGSPYLTGHEQEAHHS